MILTETCTLNELSVVTGKTYRTIKKRLQNVKPAQEDQTGIYYYLRDALPAIYKENEAKADDINSVRLEREKAEVKLVKAKAGKAIFELKLLKKTVIPAKEAEEIWSRALVAFKTKSLAIPTRTALVLKDMSDPAEIEFYLKGIVNEVLTELSQLDLNETDESDIQEKLTEGSSSAEFNSESVG